VALITAAQFLNFYDKRRINQYLSDSGSPLGSGEITDDENLAVILGAASEEVLSAVLVGERYTTDQLEALSLEEETGFLLRRLVADLAYTIIVSRRGQGAADIERLCPRHAEAQKQLDQLRSGWAIFPGIDELLYAEAGQPAIVDTDSINNANRITKLTAKANRMFPFDCRRTLPPGCGC
jgi:hypothetical protein